MNSIKKTAAKFSYSSKRRLSLPVGLEAIEHDISIAEFIKKTTQASTLKNNAQNVPIPQIVFDDCISNESSFDQLDRYPRTSSPFNDNQRRLSFNLTPVSNDKLKTRRSSCGPNFPIHSPSLENSLIENITKRSISPNYQTKWNFRDNIIDSKDNIENTISTRNRSFSLLPSLSPCFEDSPKSESNNHKKDLYFSFKESPIKTNKKRRASFHATLARSPKFPHAGVFLGQQLTPLRQRYLGDIKQEVANSNFLTKYYHSSYALLIADQIIGKGGFGMVKVGIYKGGKAAVKILNGRRAKLSVQCEKNIFDVESHPTLVTTYALITPATASMAEVTERGLKQSEIIHKSKLSLLFGISDRPIHQFNDSWAWIVSELCTPVNLLKIINMNPLLCDKDLLRILQQITAALNHIHQHGLVHLDVKPSNCFLTLSGNIKLGDFGCLSKANQAPSQVLGTAAYQAPEVLKGEPVTDRCDVFSFAVTAWQLLTLEVPYKGLHPHVIIYKVIRLGERPKTEKLTSRNTLIQNILFSIIEKCWSHDPKHRPSTPSLCRILGSLFYSSGRS